MSIWDEYYDEPPQAQNPPPPRFTPPQDDIIDRLVAMGKPQADTPLPAPNYFTPSVAPYASRGSQTRMDELPPSIAPTPSPTPAETNPLLNALHGEFTSQVGAPPLSPTAISDVHEKYKDEFATQIPVLGGALSALNTTLRRAGEGFAGAWGKTGGEEVGSVPFDKAFANVPLTGAGILTTESVFPQTKAALSTPVRDVPGLGLAMRLGEGLGGALVASSEVLAQPLAGAMTATDQQGLDKSAFAGKETPEEAKELYRGMLLGTNTPEQNRRAEELARQSYGVLEKQQPIVAAIGTTMFDPLTWVDVGGVIPKLSEVQGLRRAWAAGGDVSKAGEMVGKNVNPLEEIIFKAFQPKSVKEGEWIGKEALGIVTPKDSEAFRRAWNLFRKDPTAKVIESVERVMGNLSPFIADLNRPVEDSVKFLKLAKEALRQEKMTPELMGALKQFGLHDAQDFRRALHGLSEFDPTAMLEARAEAHKLAQSIRQTTQTARPGLYNADVAQFAKSSAENLGGGYEKLFNRVLDGWKEGKLDIDELERGIESVAKYQMLADVTDQVGASFAKTAQIPKPNVITNVVNTMKNWEGALYVGANPASLVQNVVGDISRGLWHGASFKSQKQLDALFARYGFPYVDELGAKTRGAIAGVNGAKVGAADDISAFGASVPKWFNKVPVIKQMNEAFGKSQMLGRQIARATGMERFMARNFVPPEMPPALVQFYGKEAKKVARQLAGARNYKEAYEIMARGMPTFDKYIDEMAGELTRIFSDVKGQPFEVTADMLRDAMPLALRENFNRVMSETWEAVGRGEDAKAAYQAARRRVYAEDLKGDTFDDLFPQPQAKPQAKTAPAVEPPIEQAAPIEPAPRVEPLPEANVADETMPAAPVPENAPAVTPLDENPLAPANLPDVQLTEGQQSARDYLLSLKNAEGAPQYTAEQLATWKPETLERFAGELSSFDDILRTFTAKTGKDATKSGDYLKNLLNAEITRKGFKDPQIEKIAPFRDMADIQARADEAYRLLRGYDTYPTLQEGEFKWQLRVKMLEDEMPQELQDGVETIYDALANSAAKRAGMDVDTWWTKRAAGIEGAPATGNVRGLQQDSTKVTKKAIEYFGLTNDPREAGYILDDGKMLNLSGEKQGGGTSVRGSRNLDHRDINQVFDDEETAKEASSGMLEFMNMGNVRWSQIGNTVYIDVTRTPSPKQMQQILRYATGKEVVFDLTDGKTGYHIVSKEFDKAKRQDLIELIGEVEEELSKRGLFQRPTASETKGATDFLRDGRALLRFFKGKADASTYVHEAAHLFMPTLDASDLDELARWTGLNNGDELRLLHERWVRGDATLGKLPGGKRAELQFREIGKATSDAERYAIAQEKFARGFEKYLAEGVAPTEGLQRVFDQFKDFLLEIYRGVTGSEIDVKLTDEMRALYGRMLDADQVISPQELKRIQDEAIRAARGEMAEQGLGVGAHLKAGFFDGFFQHGVPESKKIWQYTKATEGMPHWWYPISNGNNIGTTMRGKKMPPFVSALGPKKEMLFGTARKDWKLVNGADNPEWADFVLETYNQTLFPDGSRQLETIDDLLKLVDENLAHNAPSRSLAQKGKTRVPKGQMDMFASQGRVDDMPLFSGTPQTAKESAFVPEEELGKQGKLFDTRPEFGGTKPNVAPIAEMPQSPKDAPTGAQVFAARINSAEERFIDYAMERGGLTREEALAALRKYHEVKAIKIDPVMGQFQFTHGAFAEPDVIRRAAGVEETAARMPQANARPEQAAPSPKPTEGEYTGEGFRWRSDETPPPNLQASGQFTLFQEGENNARLEEAIRKMREGGQETVADGALNAEALDALEQVLLDRLYPAFSEDAMKARGVLSPEIEKEMNRYLAQAYMPELTKNMQAANAMGRFFQDATVLNYDGKWNIETAMLLERPFVHWMLHSALNYARDFIDHPAALAFLLRTTNAMHAESDKLIEQGELPERFRDKMKVSFPFSIPGIGDSLWINPLRSVMPYEDIFQLNAVDRAGFQSVKEDGTTDPTNIVNDLFGIHTPIKLAVNALTQDDAEFQNTIASIPAARLLRGITSGIVPGGVDLGLKGKYDDAYLMRALKELVADGTLTPERAKVALLQQSGGDWDLVKQRAGLENYGARELSALFGARGMVYTPGEQKYLDTKKQDAAFLSDAVRKLGGNPNMDRTQQHEFLKAKGFYATDEYQQWRAAHPELEMGGFINQYDDGGNPLPEDKAQEARARDYYLDKIGEAYWNAPELKQKLIAADLGAPFQKLFRNKDTRDLDAIPTQTILGWANALDMLLPEPVAGTNLPNPEASHVTFTTDEQNARYQSFYDEVENAYGWQQYGAKWDEYYELKKNDPQAAKAFWKTPDGMKLNAVRERVDEFFKENPDLEKVLMQAGLREPRAAADASPSNPQGAAWAQALTAVGYASREEYDAESAAYKALPKGSQDRRDYLLTHPRLLRMYQIGDSLYDDKPTSSRAGGRSTSSKSGKSNPYVPFYLRPSYQPRVTEPRAYHSGGITRGNYVSTKNLYLLFAGLKRRRGGSGGTARRASTAYRNG